MEHIDQDEQHLSHELERSPTPPRTTRKKPKPSPVELQIMEDAVEKREPQTTIPDETSATQPQE